LAGVYRMLFRRWFLSLFFFRPILLKLFFITD